MNTSGTLAPNCADAVPPIIVEAERGGCWPIEPTGHYPSPLKFTDLERLPDRQRRTHLVYFLYCAGFVKIGVTSSLKKRLASLQIGAPWQTRLVALIAGGRTTESFLHTVFREHSIGGEWFRLGDDLREAIVSAAIPRLKGSLEDEEDQYRGWIAYEAERLGFLPIEDDPSPGSRNVPGPQEESEE